MKKFRFSLATLLKIRQQHVENAQGCLFEANLYMQNVVNKLEILKKDFENIEQNIRQEQQEDMSIESLNKLYDYSFSIKRKIERQIQLIKEAKKFVDFRRKQILTAMKKLRIIETLRDKKFCEWESECNKEESKLADDIATMRFTRKDKSMK